MSDLRLDLSQISEKESKREGESSTTDDQGNESVGDSSVDGRSVMTAKEQEQVLLFAEEENKHVNRLRLIMVLVLVSVAVVVSYFVYRVTRDAEIESFEDSFQDQGTKITASFQSQADRRLSALQSFSQTITSYAVATNATFPYVTLPDFELQASNVLKLANVAAMLTFPIVSTEERTEWEAYSFREQGWLNEGLTIQSIPEDEESSVIADLIGRFDEGNFTDETDLTAELIISPVIYRVESGGTAAAPETGPGPFAPIWQLAPAIPSHRLINFNSFSHPIRAAELTTLVEKPRIILSSAGDFKENDPATANRKSVFTLFLNRWKNGTYEYEEGPVSDVYIPIYDNNGPDKEMKSVLTAYVYWQSYFADILPEDARGIIVLLKNTCGQTFTYEINGRDVQYIGSGDHHDPQYDHLMVETGLGAALGASNVPNDIEEAGTAQCFYNVQVYPSAATEDQFTTSTPVIFTSVLVAVFFFTSAIFLLFDRVVAKRHLVVNTKAIQSTAVVQSLFPENVRERLYNNTTTTNNLESSKPAKPSNADRMSMMSDNLMSAQFGIGLNDSDDSEPIADLYPECTVFFADVAGFTKWSSNREPADVFRLLEGLYKAFDKIAIQRRVFKVETIGDCYVAVTGVPKAQIDHSVRMARFAAECMVVMNQVLHRLVPLLGEETARLSMRCGLHSGPVTAGILRGDRARFQLFGDTVNTAARMESSGEKGRIHVSEDTAVSLMARGKQSWLERREAMITPKGKEAMTTYWCSPVVDSGTMSRGSQSHRSDNS